jgi:hypothetical protein
VQRQGRARERCLQGVLKVCLAQVEGRGGREHRDRHVVISKNALWRHKRKSKGDRTLKETGRYKRSRSVPRAAKNVLRAGALRAPAYPPLFLAKKPIPPYRNKPGGGQRGEGGDAGNLRRRRRRVANEAKAASRAIEGAAKPRGAAKPKGVTKR